MDIIKPGHEWQASALADAADEESTELFHNDQIGASMYARGVSDALRLAAGEDVTPGNNPVLEAIHQRYLDSI